MDPRMAAELTKRVQGQPSERRLDIVLGDVIKTDLPYFDVCISNTPYQVCDLIYEHTLLLDNLAKNVNEALKCLIILLLVDFFASGFQAPGYNALPSDLHPHVSARVCNAASCPAGRLAILPAIGQRPDVGQDHPHHESWKEQLQPSSSC